MVSRTFAFAEDYRAGLDLAHDLKDFQEGKKITCPALVIWGKDFLGSLKEDPVSVWRRSFIPECTVAEVPGGHFVAEENPVQVLAALREFLLQVN
ncbi:alpha/beta fold hydrolase [Pedobacter hartonius]|uniref:Haloacetate dehalogenase n=1 Tax=Pedobacter hartonius TaxID=425514 RepID=A0A1H4CXB1_9SPHI|nr:alpha/beta hydrolase [Pedobacter hartonius]SEA65103.1 haloacetate dehalogenase [Pedobacter hartonius]